ncbi:hypothetical protein AB6A40_005087 [Gnathostoma spinigerum]|uniref:Uncharacterized protein n=1 Tax=Gnathostoma spinigerum TaxID=75299 RepID=A0ABD6EEJ9_9BILA
MVISSSEITWRLLNTAQISLAQWNIFIHSNNQLKSCFRPLLPCFCDCCKQPEKKPEPPPPPKAPECCAPQPVCCYPQQPVVAAAPQVQYVQQPVYQHPVVQQPVYQQPVVQQPVYQQPVVQQPIYVQPIIQQPVISHPTAQHVAPAYQLVPVSQYVAAQRSYSGMAPPPTNIMARRYVLAW